MLKSDYYCSSQNNNNISQIYHSNAKANIHNGGQIHKYLSESNEILAARFNVSTQTISKWKSKVVLRDVSSFPVNISLCFIRLRNSFG